MRKCPYCDFNSHNAPQSLPQREYVDALLADLDQDLPLAQGRTLQSIFFGGGTPSLFAPENIARIFEPFFTTKALSARRGTGLGLSMVYELAKKIEAGLAVETTIGQGSTFTLILPVREADRGLGTVRAFLILVLILILIVIC